MLNAVSDVVACSYTVDTVLDGVLLSLCVCLLLIPIDVSNLRYWSHVPWQAFC